jgi:hypothetical protein
MSQSSTSVRRNYESYEIRQKGESNESKWKSPLSFLRTGAVFLSVNLMEGSVGSK